MKSSGRNEVVSLIKRARESMLEANERMSNYSHEYIRNNHGVLILLLPRRFGKTAAAAQILKDNPNAIAFVPYDSLKEIYPPEVRRRVAVIGEGMPNFDCTEDPPFVILDECGIADYEKTPNFLGTLHTQYAREFVDMPCDQTLIVMIGTPIG